MQSLRNLLFSALIFVIAANVAYSDIAAQVRDRATVEREFEDAFSRMIDNPADVKLTMRYAELAVELKDYESAIPPLERLLIQNPGLIKVRLELGIMYFLLDSDKVAQQYLTEVVHDEKATREQVDLAKEYLAKI